MMRSSKRRTCTQPQEVAKRVLAGVFVGACADVGSCVLAAASAINVAKGGVTPPRERMSADGVDSHVFVCRLPPSTLLRETHAGATDVAESTTRTVTNPLAPPGPYTSVGSRSGPCSSIGAGTLIRADRVVGRFL